MFSTRLDNLLPFSSNLKLSSANSFSLEESKIFCLVMGKPLPKQALVFTCLQHKSLQNSVGKGEIARDKRRNCSWWAISPFSTAFSTLLENFPLFLSNVELLSAVFKFGRVWNLLFGKGLTKLILYHTMPCFNGPLKEAFWKHCEKRRKCWLPAFSPFPMFFTLPINNFKFWVTFFFYRLQMLPNWISLKFCHLLMG